MSVVVNVVGQTAVSVSVAASTSVSVVASGGIGPAGFITVPGTSTQAFGTFQIAPGDGITVSTANGQFLISSYPSTTVSSLAPVQSVAGRTGTVVLQASDVTAGTFAIGRIPTIGYTALSGVPVEFVPASHTHDAAAISSGTLSIARVPTISYTALSNTPATFSPAAHTHSTTDVVAFTAAASAAAPVQSVQSRTGAVVLTRADLTAAAEVHTHSTADVVSFTAAAAAAAPVQNVAGRTGAITLAAADVAGLASVATSGSYTSLQNVPAAFNPQAHTHSTADIAGFTSSFAVSSHTHDATAITSGVLDLARIPTIGYTALSGVPATFAPQAHTHGTTDVVGLTASFSQVAHAHPYVQVINGLTGTVSIAGGSGVTVSTASSSITISAGGGGGSANIVEAATASGFPATGASQTLYHATDVRRIYFWDSIGGVYVEAGPSGGGGSGGSSSIVFEATAASFPATGAAGALYIATTDKTISFWSGSAYETIGAAAPTLDAPTSLTATAGNTQVSLAWTAPSGTITDYRVQYSTNSGSTWTTFADGTSTATSATVTGLTNGTAYVFRVAALNGAAVGTYTSASSSVTPAGTVFRAIPAMTGYTTPSGEVSGEGNQNPIHSLLWQAFDNNASTYAQFVRAGSNTPKRMVQYVFPADQKSRIGGYTMAFLQFSDAFEEWKVYGSDDLSAWTEIDSRSGITGWNHPQAKQFALSAPANYRAYRWVFQPTSDLSGPNTIHSLQLTE